MKATAALMVGCLFLVLAVCLPAVATPDAMAPPRRSLDLEGQILFAPMDSTITYLIDRSGAVNHTWASSAVPGAGVRWLGDGTILRTYKTDLWTFGGTGGGVQKILWDGTVVWDYTYSSSTHVSHHDVRMLPNGDILLLAWEKKTPAEAIAAGRNPAHVPPNGVCPEHIIEVKPTGPMSGTIVWQWHVWDHLIQDYSASLPHYGAISDHPELIDINYGSMDTDWLHCNSLDYNEQFDQILISCPYFNEVWVIDHSTTTAQAAGHTGGRYGHGGDILYRWGNPLAYGRGTASDMIFSSQHDATWIRPGYPGAGHILVFNNGLNRGYSSVDEFAPPVNETGSYFLAPGSRYGPSSLNWSYTATPTTSFYATRISGAERLLDGDTIICNGITGVFFEVTPDNDIVWSYTNTYPSPWLNDVYKINYIPPFTPPPPSETPDLDCSGSLHWSRVHPEATVTGNFTVRNIGRAGSLLNWTVNTTLLTWGEWTFTPESGMGLTPEAGDLTVQVSIIAPNQSRAHFDTYLRVENQNNASDYELIPVTLKTPTLTHEQAWQTSPLKLLLRFLAAVWHAHRLHETRFEQNIIASVFPRFTQT